MIESNVLQTCRDADTDIQFFELHWLGVILQSLPVCYLLTKRLFVKLIEVYQGWLLRIINHRFDRLLNEKEVS